MQIELKRLLTALALALVLLISTVEPVTAQATETSGWIELLEFSSIQPNGDNQFSMGSTGSVSISVPGHKMLRKVDILIWNPSGQRHNSATCTAGGKTTTLEVLAIGGNLTRIVGYVPETFYDVIRIDLKKSTTSMQTYEVLSWKVTPIGVQEFAADANVYLETYGSVSGTYTTNYNIPFWRDETGNSSDGSPWLARVTVKDWEKYDSLSIWGSATSASIESIRASISTTAIDIQVNYIDAESYESAIDGDPAYWVTSEWGKYLYNITIDLSNVDRSLTTQPLYLYFTGSYDITVQAYFNCQYVNGSVSTADTTAVTWWNRFTAFFSNLLGGTGSGGENYADHMEEQAQDMEQAVEDMNQVTRPPVDDLDVSIDPYIDPRGMAQVGTIVGGLMNNSLVMGMVMITMILSLASYVVFGKR